MLMTHFVYLRHIATVPSDSNKSFKMLSNSISECAIFQKFLDGMPPDPLVVACFTCICTLHTIYEYVFCNQRYKPQSSGCKDCAPALQKSGSTPDFIMWLTNLVALYVSNGISMIMYNNVTTLLSGWPLLTYFELSI